MVIYSDLNLTSTSKKTKLKDFDDIYQSMTTIMTVRKKSRPFRRSFGSGLRSKIFDILDSITALQIFNESIGLFNRWEPRVIIDNGKSDVIANQQENAFDIFFTGRIRGIERSDFQYTARARRKVNLNNGSL